MYNTKFVYTCPISIFTRGTGRNIQTATSITNRATIIKQIIKIIAIKRYCVYYICYF